MHELVKVGDAGILGEVIRLEGETAAIQAHEETTGIRTGEKVEGTGKPLSVELGPGLMGQIYDGIQRPLPSIQEQFGAFLQRGVVPPALDRKRRWSFHPSIEKGAKVSGGDVIGTVQETPLIEHRILASPLLGGLIEDVAAEGEYTVTAHLANPTTPTLQCNITSRGSSTNRTKNNRCIFPPVERGNSCNIRWIRNGKDCNATEPCTMRRRRHPHSCRLWRTRKRNG